MKYRKKPVVIEARLFTEETKDQVFAWIDCTRIPTWDDQDRPAILIQTLEGDMKATIGDYVIKGVNGEFYPCKPDIFEKTYDKVEDEESGPVSSGTPCTFKDNPHRVEPL